MSDRTILNPQYSNSLNNLFNGTGNIDLGNIVVNQLTVDSSNTGNDYLLTSYSNQLAITSPTGVIGKLQLGNPDDYVQLACPDLGVLQTTALQLTDTPGSVLIKPITTNYIGLVDTATNTNTANIQAGTFNALTEVTSPSYNIFSSNGQGNIDITFVNPGNYLNIPSSVLVGKSMSAVNYQGGLYYAQYISSPIRVLPPSGTSQYVWNIPWNPSDGWTINTITPIFTFVSDYPTAINSYVLNANGLYQLQITLNVSNGSGTQPSTINAINYIIMNNA